MWEMALKLDTPERQAARGRLEGLAGLTNAEYEECSNKVNDYYAKNPSQRRSGQRVFVKPNMGPLISAARGTALEQYNGEGGGRVFKWYLQSYFLHELSQFGVSVKTATERQVMHCLRSVSWRLRMQPSVTKKLQEYAGPQCFPQYFEKERWSSGRVAPANLQSGVAALGQFKDCWLRCDSCNT